MTDDAWVQRATEHTFLCGVGDVAEQLCGANMAHGIAKIQYAEDSLGLEPGALFIGAPDATVTRNSYRWRHGFGYGGKVIWNPDLAVLDAKPNGCGMLVGALAALPMEADVQEAAAAARESTLTLDGVELGYDLGESNHFVDVLELSQQLNPVVDAPRRLFIIHSSGHEHRPTSPFGPGLYVDESTELRAQARSVPTPWGPITLLQGERAARYHEFCARVQRFNVERRALFGRLLFGPFDTVCNETHQGMRDPGCLHLGAYWFDDDTRLFPLTLGPDQPVYLLQPRANFSLKAIAALGWEPRAQRLGLLDTLQQANLLPHGGGYCYPHLRRLIRVETRGDQRIFWLEPENGEAPLQMEDARPLPFVYRDLAVLHRLVELELATPVARYDIRFVIKE